MQRFLKSKIVALFLLAIVVAGVILSFERRTEWWMFGDIFFAFMMTFSHLMALTLGKLNPPAARKLEYAACIFGVLFVVAFLIEFFVIQSVM